MYKQGDFKKKFSIDYRTKEASKIIEKYPNRIPVIVEISRGNDIGDLDKQKYLVPNDLTVGQFSYIIRKRVKLPAEKAIYLTVNGSIPTTAAMMQSIYVKHRDDDGFLYIIISGENSFGSF
jgi:GABA(A) receptor-associated protein